jgi:hypothetical protein
MLTYISVFIIAEPEFSCYKKMLPLTNETWKFNSLDTTTIKIEKDACKIWKMLKESNETDLFHSNYECSYDNKYYESSIVIEWNLVCDQQYKAGLTQTIQVFGSIFGFCGGIFYFLFLF